MHWKYGIALGLLLLVTFNAAQDADANELSETEQEDIDNGEETENDGETEDGDEATKGKPMKAAGLDMEVNKRLGSAMFTMFAGNNSEDSLSFGLAKILEVDADGNEIEVENHGCRFDRELKDNVEVICEEEEAVVGEYAGLDENGNATNIPYLVSVKTCPLSSCQDAAANIKIKSYIFTSDGFICQPNCEPGENKTMLQSPVFNGTAKWDIEVSGWNFCETCGENSDITAEKLKIFFTIAAKTRGKSAEARKNAGQKFDWQACEIKEGISKEEDFEEVEEGDAEGAENDDGEENEESGEENKRQKGTGKEDGGKKPSGMDKGRNRKPRKNKGKCKPARGSSFQGKPEDQDSFTFAGSDGSNATMTFRMYPMATVDETEVLESNMGFEGPNMTVVDEELVGSGETQPRKYVVITVKKFSSKLVYDPTGDMTESGGTTSVDESSPSSTPDKYLFLLITSIFVLMKCVL